MRTFLLACLTLFAFAPVASAVHHYATSLAEVDYNRKTKKLEVALSVNPADLEWILSRRMGEKVNLESTPKVDEQIEAYVRDTFIVRDKDKQIRKLEWVGKELEVKDVWLYFEFDAPNGIEGMELSNRIFLKIQAEQANTLNVRDGRFRTTLTCTRKEPTHRIARPVPRDQETSKKQGEETASHSKD